jgi:single-strand DNA-binding protein
MTQNLKNEHKLIGYVAMDPEITTLPSGSVKASIRVPVDRNYKDKDGEKITDWFNLEAFGKQAEIIGEYVKKGTLIASSGTLHFNNYEKDGVKHSRIVHNIQAFQMLGGRPTAGGAGGEEPSARRQSTGAKTAKAAPKPADDDFAMDDDELPPF